MPWDIDFDTPVPLPDGKTARTLRQAAQFVMGLPNDQQDHPKWQLAMRILIEAAEDRGPVMFARMALSQAIHLKEEPRLGPGRRVDNGVQWRRR